jgi:tRNA modification GTPase
MTGIPSVNGDRGAADSRCSEGAKGGFRDRSIATARMKTPGNDTIAAVATGAGGGIGIVRISGPDAVAIAARILRGRGGRPLELSQPFLLVLGTVADPSSAEPIDEVLAVSMPEGRSYTGEPTVEIQAHGGRVVLDSVLQATLGAGARLAVPGEFTKRAYLSGRLDLTQAEAVAELIGAESEEALRGALHQLHGGLAGQVNPLHERLLDLVARVEAALDFDDEEIPADVPTAANLSSLAGDIRELAARAGNAAYARSGIHVALAGRTNSGKSSIFNYLLYFERSIVTPHPGTTRDYIEERKVIGGTSVTLIDTAGLRVTDDVVEAEGIRKSIQRIEEADIVVLVLDGSEPSHPDDRTLLELTTDRSPIVVISKGDLPLRIELGDYRPWASEAAVFTLSAVTGEGFPAFTAALASRSRAAYQASAPSGAAPNVRHRDALRRAAAFLDAAADRVGAGGGLLDQVALELRAAVDALGEITGETATEEIIERIFSRFCVGK